MLAAVVSAAVARHRATVRRRRLHALQSDLLAESGARDVLAPPAHLLSLYRRLPLGGHARDCGGLAPLGDLFIASLEDRRRVRRRARPDGEPAGRRRAGALSAAGDPAGLHRDGRGFLQLAPALAQRSASRSPRAGLFAGLFFNPPFPFPYENNLAMVDFVQLQRAAAQVSRARLSGLRPSTPPGRSRRRCAIRCSVTSPRRCRPLRRRTYACRR